MNEAVDLNETRFLCLVIVLAADICFQFKDFKRSFYFYHQAVRMFLVRKCSLPMQMSSMSKLKLWWLWEIFVWNWNFIFRLSKFIRKLCSIPGKQEIFKISYSSMIASAVPITIRAASNNHSTTIKDLLKENSKAMTQLSRRFRLKCS